MDSTDDESQRVKCEEEVDISSIVYRVLQRHVPPVLPEEQSAVPLADAKDLAAWVSKTDEAKVNAFIDNRFAFINFLLFKFDISFYWQCFWIFFLWYKNNFTIPVLDRFA